jgi:outer membrane receptor protein involved in Fe transport
MVRARARTFEAIPVVLCVGLLSGPPGPASAQDVEMPVMVGVHLVSEGGSAVAGAILTVVLVGGPADTTARVFEVAQGDTAFLVLRPGTAYRVHVTAPGHRSRTEDVVISKATTLRLVLAIDPYNLPPIVAAAGVGDETRARSVYSARFRDESLTYATVGEWLRDVPGVSLRGGGPGGVEVLSVRGSRPEDVLVLLDGAPLNDPLTGRADLSMIPTSTLETATLVQGASSQRYGSGAGAGVLLLTSREGDGTGVSGGLRMGSFGGLGLDLKADVAEGERRLGITLSASRAENDFSFRNPVVPSAGSELRTNADAASIHGAFHLASGPAFVSFRVDGSERGLPGRAGTSLFDEARGEDRSWTAAAGVDLPAIQGSASYGWHRLGYRASPLDPGSAHEVSEFRLAGDTRLPGTPFTLGARATRELVTGDAIQGAPGRTVVGGRLAADLLSGRFRIEPAIALDVAEAGAAVSPDVAITWNPNARTQLWARAGQGYRLPTFGDLYFESRYQLRPNPDLEAERISLDSELGVTAWTEAGGTRIEARASGWARRTENPIIWLSSAAALWSPQNVGELRASGLDVQVSLGTSEPRRTGWRAQLGGTWQSSRVGFGGNRNPLPYEPTMTGRLSLEGWIGATGGRVDIRRTGSRTTSLAATRSLERFTTVDLSTRYHFDAGSLRITLFGRMENVLDQHYQLMELYPEPGRHFTFRLEARRHIS